MYPYLKKEEAYLSEKIFRYLEDQKDAELSTLVICWGEGIAKEGL